jgi:predicted transcriptional regulator
MSSLTVRISQRSHKTLRELAKRTNQPMLAVLDQALSEFQRKCFWEQTNAAYAALRKDSETWKEELAERAAWNTTLLDGLEDE